MATVSRIVAIILKTLAAIYAVSCVLSLVLIPASANGWFGLEPDPLGGVWAIFLAMPWSLGLVAFYDLGALLVTLILVVMMLVNFAILFGIARLLERKRRWQGR